jgi:hypothetical protein
VEDRINRTYIYQAATISTITSLLNSSHGVINVLGSNDGSSSIAGMFWPCMPTPVGAKENDSVMLKSHDCILACKKRRGLK